MGDVVAGAECAIWRCGDLGLVEKAAIQVYPLLLSLCVLQSLQFKCIHSFFYFVCAAKPAIQLYPLLFSTCVLQRLHFKCIHSYFLCVCCKGCISTVFTFSFYVCVLPRLQYIVFTPFYVCAAKPAIQLFSSYFLRVLCKCCILTVLTPTLCLCSAKPAFQLYPLLLSMCVLQSLQFNCVHPIFYVCSAKAAFPLNSLLLFTCVCCKARNSTVYTHTFCLCVLQRLQFNCFHPIFYVCSAKAAIQLYTLLLFTCVCCQGCNLLYPLLLPMCLLQRLQFDCIHFFFLCACCKACNFTAYTPSSLHAEYKAKAVCWMYPLLLPTCVLLMLWLKCTLLLPYMQSKKQRLFVECIHCFFLRVCCKCCD